MPLLNTERNGVGLPSNPAQNRVPYNTSQASHHEDEAYSLSERLDSLSLSGQATQPDNEFGAPFAGAYGQPSHSDQMYSAGYPTDQYYSSYAQNPSNQAPYFPSHAPNAGYDPYMNAASNILGGPPAGDPSYQGNGGAMMAPPQFDVSNNVAAGGTYTDYVDSHDAGQSSDDRLEAHSPLYEPPVFDDNASSIDSKSASD